MKIYRSAASGLVLAALCGTGFIATPVNAASMVELWYSIDDVSDLGAPLQFFDADNDGFITGSFRFESNGNLISGQFFTFNDPIINLAASAIDVGAGSSFVVSATLYTHLPPSPYNYDLTGSGGYTDGITRNGVGIAPLSASVFQGYADAALVASAGGFQFTANGGQPLSDVYGPVSDTGSTLVCAAGCSSQRLVIAWQGTGQGDSYGLTGQFMQKPVPLPAALPLMISSLAAVGLIGSRRKG